MRATASNSTKGKWIGPFSMGKVPGQSFTQARATHMSLLRRRTPNGDSTLIVHWHDPDKVRVWRYANTSLGGFLYGDTATPTARILSLAPHDVFCAGHVNMHDGRLLVVGGTAANTKAEVGTSAVASFDPNQANLWTSSSNWAVEDSMASDRWYPTATNLPDGRVMVLSGVEYFEMPVIGGYSPQDSSASIRAFSAMGFGRFPRWPTERFTGNLPGLRDHSSNFTNNVQLRLDGRGAILTFGGIEASGAKSNTLYLTHDVATDPINGWKTFELPDVGASKPAKRSEHASAAQDAGLLVGSYDVNFYVYGGLDESGSVLGDLWRFRSTNGSVSSINGSWTQLSPSGPSPGPRYGHTMVYDPGSAGAAKLIVFGGKRSPTVWCGTDTVFVLDVSSTPTWHAIDLSASSHPGPRYRHAAIYDQIPKRPVSNDVTQRMAIHGGLGSSGTLLSDTWTLSRADNNLGYSGWSWTQDTNATGAPGVYKHSMVHEEQWDRLTVFGGDRVAEGTSGSTLTGEADTVGATNEVWQLDYSFYATGGGSNPWRLQPTTSPILRRSGHTAIYYPGKAVAVRVPQRYNSVESSGGEWDEVQSAPKFDRETYPHIYSLGDGRLFYAGRDDTSKVMSSSVAASPTWAQPGAWATDSLNAFPLGGGITGALFRANKLVKVGARGTSGVADVATFTLPGGSYSWARTSVGPLARGNANTTLLPTGDVLLSGGRGGDKFDNNMPAVRIPQMLSATSLSWTSELEASAGSLRLDPAVRGYHSTAILLPDGRVLSAGGNPGSPSDDFYLGTIFEPPYLFHPDSSGGEGYARRPIIQTAPSVIGHGCSFPVQLGESATIGSVCLIRPGAVTHAFNQDQRYVPLSFTQNGLDLQITEPGDANEAPPGDYLLFVLDNSGQRVPSVAKWVRVEQSIGPFQSGDSDLPSQTTSLTSLPGLICEHLPVVRWLAPRDDNSNSASGRVRDLDLRWGTSSICNTCTADFAEMFQVDCEPAAAFPSELQSMEISGLGVGSYHFRMVSRDDKSATGNISSLSNGVTVTVLGCEEGFYGEEGGGGGGYSLKQVGPASASASPVGGNENSLLTASAGAVTTDVMRLGTPRISGQQVYVRLRQGAQGETRLQRVSLLAADHASHTEVVQVAGVLRQATRQGATGAFTRGGASILELLQGDPASALVGDTGDTLLVCLPQSASPESSGVLYLDAQSGRITGVEEPGLLVLQRDESGTWHRTHHVLPRSRYSTLVVSGITGDTLRLVFRGNHVIKGLGRMALGDAPVEQAAPLEAATHRTLGELASNALTPGGSGAVLMSRDTLELAFAMPGTLQGDSRSWFLTVTGSSTGSGVMAARARPSGEGAETVPDRVRFESPRPNPFRSQVTMRFGLPKSEDVRLEVFDLAGRRVATVASGRLAAGWHELVWNARSDRGGLVAPGVYLSRLRVGKVREDRKLVVMP